MRGRRKRRNRGYKWIERKHEGIGGKPEASGGAKRNNEKFFGGRQN